jgi:hypothetical protein
MFLAVLAVSLVDGTQRWFISPGAHETQTKAREAVATVAAHSLKILDLAMAAAEDNKPF